MKRSLTALSALVTLFAALAAPVRLAAQEQTQAHPGYTVTDLGTLGGTSSGAGTINNSGAITGVSTDAGDLVTRSFLWNGGSLIDLGSLPAGPNSNPFNANEKLQIAGVADGASTNHDANASCFCPSNLDCHSFLWQNGAMTDLGTMGGGSSRASWINNRGQIAGISQISSIDPNGFAPCGSGPGNQIVRAYLLQNGKFKDLGTLGGYCAAALGINDAGQVAGGSDTTTVIDPTLGFVPHHAYRWTKGVMTDLGTLGGGISIAEGLNARGAVFGLSTLLGEQHFNAFLWQNSLLSNLGTLPGDTDSDAVGMNSFGQVVGVSFNSSSTRAFLWENGVMTDLNTLIDPNSGFQLANAQGINDAGEIAAQALVESTGEFHAVLLTPSNNSIRGNPGRVALTEDLRKMLLQKYGHKKMKFLTQGQ